MTHAAAMTLRTGDRCDSIAAAGDSIDISNARMCLVLYLLLSVEGERWLHG